MQRYGGLKQYLSIARRDPQAGVPGEDDVGGSG